MGRGLSSSWGFVSSVLTNWKDFKDLRCWNPYDGCNPSPKITWTHPCSIGDLFLVVYFVDFSFSINEITRYLLGNFPRAIYQVGEAVGMWVTRYIPAGRANKCILTSANLIYDTIKHMPRQGDRHFLVIHLHLFWFASACVRFGGGGGGGGAPRSRLQS